MFFWAVKPSLATILIYLTDIVVAHKTFFFLEYSGEKSNTISNIVLLWG